MDSNRLILVAVGLLVLGGAIFFAQGYTEKKEQEGRASLFQIQKTFEAELKAVPEAERAQGAALDVDAKFPKTTAELNGLINSKKGTDHTLYEASFRLGNLYFQYQQDKKAETAFNQALQFASGAFQKATVYLMLGMTNEKNQKFKEAVDVYTQGMSKGFDGLKEEFLLGLVRVHVRLNEKDKAKLFSEKLSAEFSGSRAAKDAQELVR